MTSNLESDGLAAGMGGNGLAAPTELTAAIRLSEAAAENQAAIKNALRRAADVLQQCTSHPPGRNPRFPTASAVTAPLRTPVPEKFSGSPEKTRCVADVEGRLLNTGQMGTAAGLRQDVFVERELQFAEVEDLVRYVLSLVGRVDRAKLAPDANAVVAAVYGAPAGHRKSTKPFRGTCWGCGERGHRSLECRTKPFPGKGPGAREKKTQNRPARD